MSTPIEIIIPEIDEIVKFFTPVQSRLIAEKLPENEAHERRRKAKKTAQKDSPKERSSTNREASFPLQRSIFSF